jgi:hypothetical protein
MDQQRNLLVNIWYMGDMPQYFADMEQFHVDHLELADSIRYIAEECEALSKLPAGLLSDFMHAGRGELARTGRANQDLKEMVQAA